MNTLKFNDADLKANREGRLSDAQQKRLDTDVAMIHRHSKYMFWFMGAIFGVIAIVTIINGLRDAADNGSGSLSQFSLAEYGMMGGSFLLMSIFVGVSYWWSLRGLNNGTIRTIEGTAEVISTFTTVKGMRVPLNRLRLRQSWYSKLTFHFQDKESLRYFKNGTCYRVYYLPYAMPQALSAEEIEPEKTKR